MAPATTPDLDADRLALLAHHEASLAAHRANNPEFFLQDRVEKYTLVNRGEILNPTNEQTLAVKVAGVQTQDDGAETEIDAVWARVSMYEKRGERWINTGNASNRKP